MFKKIVSILCALTLSICSTGCSNSNNEHDNGKMRKDMTSSQYASEMDLGINLGNTMEAFWQDEKNMTSGSSIIGDGQILNYETCWGAIETTKQVIDGMKNSGFNTIRVPVYWGNSMEDNGEFKISDELFNRVEEIINYCRSNDLYVVINIHHYDEFIIKNYSQDEVIDIMANLWRQIAERYKNYSDYLIFEGFNENVGTTREEDNLSEDQTFDYVNRLNQTFVDTVRSTGGNNENRLLIVSGYWTNIDLTTDERFIVPTDTASDKIMVSVHYVDNSMYWANNVGTKQWLAYSKSQCELLKKAFTDKGYTVFIGECTSIYNDERFGSNAECSSSTQCLEIMYDLMLEYGFVPVLWDVNDNFYSRTEYTIKSDTDRELIKKLSQELS